MVWFGKNDGKHDDDYIEENCFCKPKISIKDLKQQLKNEKLKQELENYFFQILDKEDE